MQEAERRTKEDVESKGQTNPSDNGALGTVTYKLEKWLQ